MVVARLAPAGGALLLVALLLTLAECAARVGTDIPFLGTSESLFVAARFVTSRGNAANAVAISFGTRVYTDADGFRVPAPGYRYPADRSLLILGDSVAFGPAVPEEETFAGLLRAARPTWNVLNAAVIGHGAVDYPNVVRSVLDAFDDVEQVVLIYCLNDPSPASTQEITARLAGGTPHRAHRTSWVERLRERPPVARANELLRERSKLYLWVKNLTTNPVRRHFLSDYGLYERGDAEVVAALEPLAVIAESLRSRGVDFLVIAVPYAYQARDTADAWRLPQRIVARFLTERGIHFVDATEPLLDPLGERAFLAGDPMHLSRAGHRAFYELLAGRVALR
jgi:hypothetical protein